MFKVVTRILADRLSVLASHIISLNQFGFLKGRSITNCMAMKIDVKKAFDTLDCDFLLMELEAFGFFNGF